MEKNSRDFFELLNRVTPKQAQSAKEERESEIKEYNNDLRSRAKSLQELVTTEIFVVTNAIGQDYQTRVSPSSEIRYGEKPPSYSAGFTSKTILEVFPENNDNPIRTLIFNGRCEVRAGEHISAKIPRYEEERMKLIGLQRFSSDKRDVFYVDRNFTEKEKAIEISILGRNKRTDRATDYHAYIEQTD